MKAGRFSPLGLAGFLCYREATVVFPIERAVVCGKDERAIESVLTGRVVHTQPFLREIGRLG